MDYLKFTIYLGIACAMTAFFFRYLVLYIEEPANLLKAPENITRTAQYHPHKMKYCYYILYIVCGFVDIGYYLCTSSVLGFAFTIPFFFIQCDSDRKNQTVYTLINRMFLACSIFLFVEAQMMTGITMSYIDGALILCFIMFFFILYKRGNMGKGDFIAITGFLFLYQTILSRTYVLESFVYFLYFLIISYISFGMYGLYKRKKEHIDLHTYRAAFYPFLCIGFVGTSGIGVITHFI